MKFNINREKYIDSGLVNEQSHPTAPLLIYNYSQKCQFSKAWDDVTRMCRGLIVNKDTNEIVARPFAKFFNYEEHGGTIPKLEYTYAPDVYSKLDGSLGILYWVGDEPYIATRGSFASDQAKWATDWIRENIDCSQFDKELTYLFEILVNWNRIVVKYDYEGLILLAVIDTQTGRSINLQEHLGEMQKRLASNDQSKHLHTSVEGMETMPKMSVGELSKGQSEVSQSSSTDNEKLAQEKQEASSGVSSDSVSKDTGVDLSSQKCPVCGLQKSVSSMRDGLRPHQGQETSESSESKVEKDNAIGSVEVPSCMCKLPQDKNFLTLKVVKKYPFTSYEELKGLNTQNEEGFVLHYVADDTRVKIKFEDYVKLHKVMTGLSEIGIWEMLKEEKDPMTPEIPDEMHAWIDEVSKRMRLSFFEIENEAKKIHDLCKPIETRKDQAFYIRANTKQAYQGIVFSMLDGKDYKTAIWRLVRPRGSHTFRNDIDA